MGSGALGSDHPYQTGGVVLLGAVLQASHLATKTLYTSAETSERGRYVLADLPAGTYDLAVITDRGAYAVDSLVTLAPGESKNINFAVRPAAANPECRGRRTGRDG